MERQPIDLNDAEQAILNKYLEIVGRGIEARNFLQITLTAVRDRAGQKGLYEISEDRRQLIPKDGSEQQENTDGG